MIAKQQAKGEQTHPVFLHAVEKYDKVENTNTQNDYKITQKKTDKKNLFFVFCECFWIQRKKIKIVQKNF